MSQSHSRGLVIGLTGGIACGKTTVANYLAQHGALIVSADKLAHQLLQKDSPIRQQLVEAFGIAILEADGSVSRPRLGSIVFQDASAREQLNALTHPIIKRRSLTQAYQHVIEAPHHIAVIDAPLLFEAGMESHVDAVIVVSATKATQVQRILHRASEQGRSMGMEEARARIASQLDVAQKAKQADFVIDNEHEDLDELQKEVDALWEKLQCVQKRQLALDEFGRSVV